MCTAWTEKSVLHPMKAFKLSFGVKTLVFPGGEKARSLTLFTAQAVHLSNKYVEYGLSMMSQGPRGIFDIFDFTVMLLTVHNISNAIHLT